MAKHVLKFASDNSPTILTVVGVGGTLLTAYLTGKATFRVAEHIREEEERRLYAHDGDPSEYVPLTPAEQAKFVFEEGCWREYIPAAATALTAISGIVAANRIGAQRAAALTAAYSITERAFHEYKEKVYDRLGRNKEQGIRDEIAQDRVTKNPPVNREVILAGQGSTMCYEAYTGRYFLSSVEEIKRAQNEINHQVNNDFYASLTEFYNKLGLPRTSHSDDFGWNSDKLLDIQISAVLAEGTQQPCISIEFAVAPIRGFSRIN